MNSDRERLIEILTQCCRGGSEELGVPACGKEFCDKNKEECNGKLADHLLETGERRKEDETGCLSRKPKRPERTQKG